ncbi:helix-turn-helix domain-containing protein [Brevibacillus laterosporus]|uniref:helix-turn-helix domain-containing protein n=1 Tax=Brevibacillus laterosporus TaxID=1465 RepID=UPI001EF3027E|nr:helix-turn-helix domain-containing protein [Brevibacillus laterosporus]MCG7320176.1 helix-turn-helix domain-containing protein [Brevibacillus laterosporus]
MNFFSKTKDEKDKIFQDMREEYSQWRNELKEVNKPFFTIHSDFEHQFLKDISGGALKLFIYLGFRAKYQTGETWEGIEKISLFFGKDHRTIANWFKELEDIGLIFRAQKGFKMRANTFLRPYGFLFDVIDTGESSNVEHILNDIKTSKDLEYIPKFGLMLNYGFKEFTFLLINQQNQLFHTSCFCNFNESQIKMLRIHLKKMGIRFDNYDIDSPIYKAHNKKSLVYTYLIKYLNE